MLSPVLGAGLVLAALALLLGLAQVARHSGLLGPEGSRKFVHIGMAFTSLAFPWLFREHGHVWLLCGSAALGLLLVRFWGPLRSRLGGALGGVERASLGEFYFPLAIAILFTLSHHRPVRYVIPVLLLGLADATAALVGRRYGLTAYRTSEGHKSFEGSMAFFLVAFFSVHVPLLLFTDTGRLETLLIALCLALVATLFEAIAGKGLDNLLVPLLGYAVLDRYLRLGAAELGIRLGLTLALVVFTWIWRRRATLQDSALFGASLAGYASYAIGGWHFLLPPLLLFVAYTRFDRRTLQDHPGVHDMGAVLAVTGPGLLWLLLYHETGRGEVFLPYLASYAAQLAFTGLAQLAWKHPRIPAFSLILRCGLISWGVLLLPAITWNLLGRGAWPVLLADAGLILAGVLGASWLFSRQAGFRDLPRTPARWLVQALLGFGASLLAGARLLGALPGRM